MEHCLSKHCGGLHKVVRDSPQCDEIPALQCRLKDLVPVPAVFGDELALPLAHRRRRRRADARRRGLPAIGRELAVDGATAAASPIGRELAIDSSASRLVLYREHWKHRLLQWRRVWLGVGCERIDSDGRDACAQRRHNRPRGVVQLCNASRSNACAARRVPSGSAYALAAPKARRR